MNTKDLMIGNWVNRKYYNPNPTNPTWELEKCKVVGTRTNGIIVKLKGGSHSVLDYWEGIPLTEEILLKCGFRLHNNVYDDDTRFTISQNGDLFLSDWSGKTIGVIRYLHDLQNLYKCLTKQELEIRK